MQHNKTHQNTLGLSLTLEFPQNMDRNTYKYIVIESNTLQQ